MQEWPDMSEECDYRAAQPARDITSHYNQHARALPPLQVSQQVRIQDHAFKRWDKVGKVAGHGNIKSCYLAVEFYVGTGVTFAQQSPPLYTRQQLTLPENDLSLAAYATRVP